MYRDFIIAKISAESTTIKSFYLKPIDNEPLDTYLPGQFIQAKIKIEGLDKELVRNYTLSDSPKKEYYRLTIKREDNGMVSKHFHDVIKVGDLIKLSKPTGYFYMPINDPKPIVLLSGGVGITPMLSILEYITENEPFKKVLFLHSSVNKDVQPMMPRLKALELSNGNLFLSIHHSNPNDYEVQYLDYHNKGHITKEYLSKVLPSTESDFYICGPTGFMEAMSEYLLELGIKESNINFEFFGEGKKLGQQASIQEMEVENFKVNFTKSGIETNWNGETSSILELAESVGLTPKFSCRMGTCSTCETVLINGSIEYDPEPFMENATNKIFICCAKPVSNIEIEL